MHNNTDLKHKLDVTTSARKTSKPVRQSTAARSWPQRAEGMAKSIPLEYVIAGPADDEDFAQAEYLAELLMVSLPSVKVTLMPILPEAWPDFVGQKAAFLGCKQRAPLAWTSSGKVIGGLPEWSGEVETKYSLRVRGIDFSVWPKVAKENLAAAKKAASGVVDPPIGAPTGSAGETGATRGEAVAEELITGNSRYLEERSGGSGSTATRALGALAEPAAVVVCLTPLAAPAHVLLGCAEAALAVVPCTRAGLEDLAIGNAEHACIAQKCKALVLLAGPTAELGMYVGAARDARDARDAPLATPHAAVLQKMLPALSRTMQVAPPRCTANEVAQLCLEEYVRGCGEELLSLSPVLAELARRKELHVERLVVGEDGAVSIV